MQETPLWVENKLSQACSVLLETQPLMGTSENTALKKTLSVGGNIMLNISQIVSGTTKLVVDT